MNAKEIAKALIWVGGSKYHITNLKLNKLVYLAYAHYLHNDVSLFEDEIEAWLYGPVVRSVYEAYKCYGKEPIQSSENASEDAQVIAKEILDFYGEYCAYDLVDYLHRKNGAWRQTLDHNEKKITDARILASQDGVFENFVPEKTLTDAAKKGDIRWAEVYKSLESK